MMSILPNKGAVAAFRTSLIAVALPALTWMVAAGQAQAATYDCRVAKVEAPHPYLPERIVLSADKRFVEVTVDAIEIENVKTLPTPAEVVYRGAKRLRLSWSSLDYEVVGNIPRHLMKGFGSLKPEEFSFQLSLDKSGRHFRATVEYKPYYLSNGVASGRCSIIE